MPGIQLPIQVEPYNWYAFNQWEMNLTNILPNNTANPANITVCDLDTLWVVYDFTSHHLLTLDVFPVGAGQIDFDGTTILDVPFTQDLQDGIQHHLGETPTDQWTVFNHWETNGHVFTPSATNSEVDFTMSMEDTIVAVYDLIPHSLITVVVEPANTGLINLSNGLSTRYSMVMDLANSSTLDLTITPDRHYEFAGWSSVNGVLFNPDSITKEVLYTVNFPDTIVAHLKPEMYTYYMPNSFSPNGDNINDCIGPVGNAFDVESYHLVIFGRHGEVVFETDDFDACWNGAYQTGEYYSHNDVYCYEMNVKSVFDKEIQKITGSITLVR
jgi:gliding motility-associated-like protein